MIPELALQKIEEDLRDHASLRTNILFALTDEIRTFNAFLKANPDVLERYRQHRDAASKRDHEIGERDSGDGGSDLPIPLP